ncbi:arginine--tRNA ligase [Candidatus Babeliales bacterium]|nr:arginine--tRNA ligase [Candidatus Babeliales bacterium]
MNVFEQIQQSFTTYLIQEFRIPLEIINESQFELNTDPTKQNFGDINANVAMICAPKMKKNSRAFAQEIVTKFSHPLVDHIEIAGPGFLNFFLAPSWYTQIATQIHEQKSDFFKPNTILKQKINVEFVSANPTGPMHVGHGRNGILGDVLANILTFLGNDVTKEFYINDAGAQMIKLQNSFKIRCMQELGLYQELPEDAYHGPYLIDLAKTCVTQFGQNLQQEPDNFFQSYAKNHMLEQLQTTLQNYGILFDIWFSEKTLHDHGKVAAAIEKLIQSGHTFEDEGALWFRSTTFGDDKDRVLKKANGELTYVAADISYLIDKIERGFTKIVMVLGHDHHSYKIRLEAIMQALNYDPKNLNVILYQLVHIMKDGQSVKMSKRSGNMVTLEEVVEEVGKNVARYFFLNRKADAELQFDVNLALSQSNENPIYYIQYAFVRTVSIQRNASEQGFFAAPTITNHFNDTEKIILKKICALKNLIANIGKNHQIHVLAYFTYEFATLFHQYYNLQRVIDEKNPEQTAQRLYLVNLVQEALKTSLFLMGITPMQKM